MPPKTAPTVNLPALKKDFGDAQKDIKLLQSLEDARAQARQFTQRKQQQQIPKPKGQAGRSTGYNIQKEMGLADNKALYDTLVAKVRHHAARYLDVTKSLREHDDKRVIEVIALIQQALTPNFDAFKNGWPIRDLMAQYMANSKQGAKKHQKLLNDGKENFVDMLNDAKEVMEVGVDDVNQQEPPALKIVLKQKRPQPQDDSDKGKLAKKPRTTHALQTARVAADEPTGISIIEPSSSEACDTTSSNPLTFTWSELDIGFKCPTAECEDPIPMNLPKALRDRFREHALAKHNGADQAVIDRIEMLICVEVGMARVWDRATRMAQQAGYPTVNLRAVPDRILAKEPEILRLVGVPAHRDVTRCWQELCAAIEDAKSSLDALAKGKVIPDEVNEIIQPGYYGAAGSAVIENTLMVLFGDADFRPSTTAPLTFKDFGEYFLIPHLICMLIAEDMNILIADSWEILKKSSGAGSVLMSLTAQDDLLDEVFEDNVRRRRKRTADGTTIDHGAPNAKLEAPRNKKDVEGATGMAPPRLAERPKPRPVVATHAGGKVLSVADYPVQTVRERRSTRSKTKGTGEATKVNSKKSTKPEVTKEDDKKSDKARA